MATQGMASAEWGWFRLPMAHPKRIVARSSVKRKTGRRSEARTYSGKAYKVSSYFGMYKGRER